MAHCPIVAKTFLLAWMFLTMGCSSDGPEQHVLNPPVTDMGNNPSGGNTEDGSIPDVTPSMEQRIQAIIDTRIGINKLVGLSLSIRVDGEERWSHTGGAIQKDMRFGIASITKTVVAATIMRLEEEGLLGLDNPISAYLTIIPPNVDPSITIYQLLSHQAGLRDYFAHPDIWPRVEGSLETAIPPIEVADYIGAPIFNAGERFEYSNANYLILGLIIEAVTQKTVGSVMREKFWEPLGLNATYFGANEPIEGVIAVPWRDTDGDGTLENIAMEFGPAYHSVFYTAADVFTTASDLSMWAYHLFAGEAVSGTSREKMLTFIDLDDPVANGYGLGIRRVILGNRTTWGHTGGMRGYGSFMFYDPISKVSIALLNNQSRSENGPLLRYEVVQETLLAVFEELAP